MYEKILKGIRKVSQKVVPLHNGFMTPYEITYRYVTWDIFFDEISVSLDCCITATDTLNNQAQVYILGLTGLNK